MGQLSRTSRTHRPQLAFLSCRATRDICDLARGSWTTLGMSRNEEKKIRRARTHGEFKSDFSQLDCYYGYVSRFPGTSAVTVPSASLSCLPTVLWKTDALPPARATVALFFRRILASRPLR